jgi:alpha-beta hydrolase superfamily lysophospholipase
VPTLILHGDADRILPAEEVNSELVKFLAKPGIDVVKLSLRLK